MAMRSALLRAIGAFGTATLVVACGNSSNGGGTVDAGSTSMADATLTFAAGSSLSLSPSTTTSLTVRSSVDGAITVWLTGAYGDASLAAGSVAATSGSAAIVLRATSGASSFTLHARGPSGVEATLAVSVAAVQTTTLDVTASYAGLRAAAPVVASVYIDQTCASLSGAVADGMLATTGALGAPIAIANVPVGVAVAAYARMGGYAAGCNDVSNLTFGATGSVTVPLYDVTDFAAADLVVALTQVPVDADAAGWTALFDRARMQADSALVNGTPSNEAGALLDAMQAASDDVGDFTSARQGGSWDAATASWLAAHAPSLVSRVDGWLQTAEPKTFGDIDLKVTGNGKNTAGAPVTVTSFAGIGAAAAGVTVGSFSSGSDADALTLQGSLFLQPAQLLTALSSNPEGTSAPDALAAEIDCTGLAETLSDNGTAYAGCSSSCLADVCAGGLAAMWNRAAQATMSGTSVTSLAISGHGAVTVDDQATPSAVTSGTWSATVGAATGVTQMHGTMATPAGTMAH